MKIEFENNSTVETIKPQTDSDGKGTRSNFITSWCYDTLEEKWIVKTLDTREPVSRYIPEWVFEKMGI